MKAAFDQSLLPLDAIFLTCATGEDRCFGVVERLDEWRPDATILCTYSGTNARRDNQKKRITAALTARHLTYADVECLENDPATCLRLLLPKLRLLLESPHCNLVVCQL